MTTSLAARFIATNGLSNKELKRILEDFEDYLRTIMDWQQVSVEKQQEELQQMLLNTAAAIWNLRSRLELAHGLLEEYLSKRTNGDIELVSLVEAKDALQWCLQEIESCQTLSERRSQSG